MPSTSKSHIAVNVGFPVFSAAFTGDRNIVLGGGGGSSRTGVRNRLSCYEINLQSRTFEKTNEMMLPASEDAPMSMIYHREHRDLVCGINSDETKAAQGENEDLRVFSLEESGLTLKRSQRILQSAKAEDYQKTSAFSENGALIGLGYTSGQFSLLTYPSLDKVFPFVFYGQDDVYDVDFQERGDLVLGVSTKQLLFWSTAATEQPSPVQTIENPSFKRTLTCTFRSAKFGRGPTAGYFYTVVNAAPSVGSKKSKASEHKSFVSQWDMKSWKLVRTRAIAQRPLTTFAISHGGRMLAYGSSDLSVGVVNSDNLQPILTVLRAHDFPATTLLWSPDDQLVVAASADATVRVINVEMSSAESRNSARRTIILLLLSVLLAILVQYLVSDRARQTLHAHWRL